MTPEAADTIRRAADVVQWFDLAVSVAVLLALLCALARWPRNWRLIVLPATYMALSVAFYVAVLMDAVPSPWTSLFSSALRLYSYILAIVIGGAVVLSTVGSDDDDDDDDDDIEGWEADE